MKATRIIGVLSVLSVLLTWLSPAHAQGLDLGEEEPEAVVEAGSQFPYSGWAMLIFFTYLVLGAGLAGFLVFKKKKAWDPAFRLRDLPDSAKTITTLVILAYGLAHLFAVIAVYLKSHNVHPSAEEYFFYMNPSKLAATSHAHFFGHATMYALTSVAFLFTSISERWKVFFICLALGGGLLDVPSWWMIKYAGGKFEAFSALFGTMSAAGWGFMTFRILYELWFQKETANEVH